MIRLLMILVISLGSLFALDVDALMQADKKALKLYQADNDTNDNLNKAVKVLEKAGIKEIISKRPVGMSKSQYIQVLSDYGYLLTRYTNEYSWVAKRHCDAKPVLERVRELDPKRASPYLLLGDLYLRIYLVDDYLTGYPRRYADAPCTRFQVIEPLVFQAKQMYLKYEQLMKDSNLSDKIPERLKLILSQDRIYMVRDIFSSGERKKEETELCQLYVDTLNRLPESERISNCEHNISTISTEFEKVPYEALSDKLKERYQSKQKRKEPTGEFRYKETVFMDFGQLLFDEKIVTDGGVFCYYKLLDFTKDETKKQGENK